MCFSKISLYSVAVAENTEESKHIDIARRIKMDGTTPLSQEMKKLLHVLIVDDEAIVRDDIKKLFCWEKLRRM